MIFFISAQIYSYNGLTRPRCMHPTIDNNLPSIDIRFGSNQNHSEVSFASHIHSCAAMNEGYIKIYQWVINTHP